MTLDRIDLVFPCAGRGERFGNKFKPFLKIGDLTFLEKAYEPFIKWDKFINKIYIIITKQQEIDYKVSSKVRALFSDKVQVLLLDKETRGPLQTFCKGYIFEKNSLNKKEDKKSSVIVCDCDHSVNVDLLFESIVTKKQTDIIIPTYKIEEKEQHNWSKILLSDGKIQKFANKEKVDFKKYDVRGIIGCLFFRDYKSFLNIEEKQIEFFEFMQNEFVNGKGIELAGVKNAYFYGDEPMLQACLEKRRGECTIFCDIDGVIIEHKDHSTNEKESNIVIEGFHKLKELSEQNHKIVLTTARSSKNRKKLERMLKEKGIYYDELIMSLPSGPRFLINDRKPKKPFTSQANSYEVERDRGLSLFDIDRVLDSNNIKIVSDMSANSFAKTYLLKNGEKHFVRKHIFKEGREKHYGQLKRQKNDIERMNFIAKGVCPKIYCEHDSDIEYYYDMEYLSGYKPLSEFDDEGVVLFALEKILDVMRSSIYTYSTRVDPLVWVHEFLQEKIYPKFTSFSLLGEDFLTIIESEEIWINEKKYVGLRKLFDLLDFQDLGPREISIVHGDLTLENILYNNENKDVRLIDMDGSRLFDAKELDLGKQAQSIIANYQSWKSLEGSNLIRSVNIEQKKFITEEKNYIHINTQLSNNLFDRWSSILSVPQRDTIRKAYFYMSTYFIRFVPFRLQLGREHGIYSLLMAIVWLNKLITEEFENEN